MGFNWSPDTKRKERSVDQLLFMFPTNDVPAGQSEVLLVDQERKGIEAFHNFSERNQAIEE